MKPAHNKEVLEEPVQGEHRGLGIKESLRREQAGSILSMSKMEGAGRWHSQASKPRTRRLPRVPQWPRDTGPRCHAQGRQMPPLGCVQQLRAEKQNTPFLVLPLRDLGEEGRIP